MKKSFIYLLLTTTLLTSCKQSENDSNSYDDTPTMQLKDAAHEMMNGRNIQDSIDNARSEEEDRDGHNAYVMQRMDSIDEAEAQQQNNQEQTQQESSRIYGVCKLCHTEIVSNYDLRWLYDCDPYYALDYLAPSNYVKGPFHETCAHDYCNGNYD
jgi:hypothetical protein